MSISIVLARAAAFVAAHALIVAVAAVTDGASARESSKAASSHFVNTIHPIIVKTGNKHHHRHHPRFVFVDRPYDYWMTVNRCVVHRIASDGSLVRVVVRSVKPCRVAVPATAQGLIDY